MTSEIAAKPIEPNKTGANAAPAGTNTGIIRPAGGWQHKTGRLFWRPLARWLASLAAILAANAILSALPLSPQAARLALIAHFASAIVSGGVILLMLRDVQHRLHDPLAHLRRWAMRVRGGDLSWRIAAPADAGEFTALASDINSLSDELQALTEDMDRQVQNQTERLAQKNRSLEILYDVAASLNDAHDIDDLLRRFLHTLMGVVDARAATVRLVTPEGYMRLVASIGLDPAVVEKERLMPSDRCLCGEALSSGEIRYQKDLRHCAREIDYPFFNGEPMEMIVVPLKYRDKTVGVYNLFTKAPDFVLHEDISDLLTSVSRHLGMAIEKTRLDTEAHRLSIMQERNMLAHELHDSLAQSLASLRMQVRMLDETMATSDNPGARREVMQLKTNMDDAYAELRQLLLHCRAPMDERGLVPAIEDLVERFRRETGIATFLQKESHDFRLPPELEVHVLHIVQESLANVRKYSKARNVRVLLNGDKQGNHQVLIEDDGIGIVPRQDESLPGEHLGISIMHERAAHLGGTLAMESEPGEGTRVLLRFPAHIAVAHRPINFG